MGGGHQREPANTAHNLPNLCASLDRLPSSFLILFYTKPQPTTLTVLPIRISWPILASAHAPNNDLDECGA